MPTAEMTMTPSAIGATRHDAQVHCVAHRTLHHRTLTTELTYDDTDLLFRNGRNGLTTPIHQDKNQLSAQGGTPPQKHTISTMGSMDSSPREQIPTSCVF